MSQRISANFDDQSKQVNNERSEGLKDFWHEAKPSESGRTCQAANGLATRQITWAGRERQPADDLLLVGAEDAAEQSALGWLGSALRGRFRQRLGRWRVLTGTGALGFGFMDASSNFQKPIAQAAI